MKPTQSIVISLFLLICCAVAQAQNSKPAAPPSMSGVLDSAIGNVEREFVSAAEAMPDDKYSFVPTSGEFKGVRNFALQVKHVAAVNYMVAAAIRG
jgi:hypothetical protein